jgi:hypothetical protein
MQQGSVIRQHRKIGPDVWCFRWWEAGPNGNRVHRRIVLGTAEQMRDAASARQLTFGLVQEINTTDIRLTGISMTLAQLADHFHQRKLGRSNGRISYSTKRAYKGYLDKWIVPRWGSYLLPNIKAVEVELWLRNLERAAGTCCKIRNVMSVLFNHARRYDLYDRNPIQWVLQDRGFAKTRTAPRLSDQCPEGLASQNTISNAGELGVRQSQKTRKNPILGTTTSSSPHPPRGAKDGHHKANWLAHVSQNLLDTSSCNGCGTEGDAGTDAAFNNPRHSRHLHPSGHNRKTICADCCRSALRHKVMTQINGAWP